MKILTVLNGVELDEFKQQILEDSRDAMFNYLYSMGRLVVAKATKMKLDDEDSITGVVDVSHNLLYIRESMMDDDILSDSIIDLVTECWGYEQLYKQANPDYTPRTKTRVTHTCYT